MDQAIRPKQPAPPAPQPAPTNDEVRREYQEGVENFIGWIGNANPAEPPPPAPRRPIDNDEVRRQLGPTGKEKTR